MVIVIFLFALLVFALIGAMIYLVILELPDMLDAWKRAKKKIRELKEMDGES
jgi:hypothetical protein